MKNDLQEFQNPIYIENSGLIILHPFLKVLFERCGLTKGNVFIDERSKHTAVYLLEYAATGSTNGEKQMWIINKLLCGLSVTDTIEEGITLKDTDKETVDDLLKAIIQQWPILGDISILGLRESFIQRSGKIEEEEEHYILKVEQKSFDMLLDHLPWSISIIRSNWMKKFISVEWR